MPHPANRMNALQVVRHATKSFEVTIKDQDGRPVKLGGAAMVMSIGPVGGPPTVTKRTGEGIEVTDADKGKARVTLSSDDTASLTAGTHKYDLWAFWPGGVPEVRYQIIKLADLIASDGMTTFE